MMPVDYEINIPIASYILYRHTDTLKNPLESHFKGNTFYRSNHRRILDNQSVELIKIQAKSHT